MMKTQKDIILERYKKASQQDEEFLKNRWGSYESMIGRFKAVIDAVDFTNRDSWLDAGCGTGRLFIEADNIEKFELVIGIDFSYDQIKMAHERNVHKNVRFVLSDLEHIPFKEKFSLVTCIGTIYCCGIELKKIISSLSTAAAVGGLLVINSVNPFWHRFKESQNLNIEANIYPTVETIEKEILGLDLKIVDRFGMNPLEDSLYPEVSSETKEYLIVAEKGR